MRSSISKAKTRSAVGIASLFVSAALVGLAPSAGAVQSPGATAPRPPEADLAISMSDAPDPAQVGSEVTYSIAVVNEGSSRAMRSTMIDELPPSVTLVSVGSSQGSCSMAAPVVCELGTIEASQVADVTIVVRADEAGEVENTASISHQHSDPDPSDNSATTSTTVAGSPDGGLSQCGGILENEYRYDSLGREQITAAGSCTFIASGGTAQAFVGAAMFPLKWPNCLWPICSDPRLVNPRYPNVHIRISSPEGSIASCSLVYSCLAANVHDVPPGTALTCTAYASATEQDMPVIGSFACSSK